MPIKFRTMKNFQNIFGFQGFGNEHFWTAGTDQGEEGSFFWMSTGRPVTFTNWNAGEPVRANIFIKIKCVYNVTIASSSNTRLTLVVFPFFLPSGDKFSSVNHGIRIKAIYSSCVRQRFVFILF